MGIDYTSSKRYPGARKSADYLAPGYLHRAKKRQAPPAGPVFDWLRCLFLGDLDGDFLRLHCLGFRDGESQDALLVAGFDRFGLDLSREADAAGEGAVSALAQTVFLAV